MMKITGLSQLFKWENLHNWWLTKYFFAPLFFSVTLCYSLTFNINSKSKGLSFQLNCVACMHFGRLYYARSVQ